MNAKQRRRYNHRFIMQERQWARRVLKCENAGTFMKLFARLVLQPGAYKKDPAFDWWGPDVAQNLPRQNEPLPIHHRRL